MSLIEAIVLGAVQGATEFLPISSTAHLVLVPWFMGWQDPGLAFDVALHLGTLVALLIYFRRDWGYLIRCALGYLRGRNPDPLVMYLVLATIPAALAGVFLEDYVESTLRDVRVIGLSLIILGLVLAIAEIKSRRKKDMNDITLLDAMIVGCAQAVALIPGVSRSGVTMTAGLFRGMRRETAARFSFFLSTPVIGGAVGKKMIDIAKAGLPPGETLPFVVGIIVSGLVGYASIKFLLQYLQSRNTFLFVYYRIALGIVVYLAFWSGFR
jgi:undecaprenyl-diphosphatase